MINYENAGSAVWRIHKMRPVDERSRVVVAENLENHVWSALPVEIDRVLVDNLFFERPNCICSESPESLWDIDTVRRYIMRMTGTRV